MRIAGVVLAGGQSRRFGSDKAEEIFQGRSLLDWSLATLEPHVELLFVSGRTYRDHPSVTDRPAAGLGPLGGLAGALQAARARGYSHLLSLPCDTPRVPHALLVELRSRPEGCFVEACPVIGFWPTALGEALEKHLADGGARSVRGWAEATAIASYAGFAPIPNVNSVADLSDLAPDHE